MTDKTPVLEHPPEVSTDLKAYPFIQERVQKLPYAVVKTHHLIPLRENEGVLLVAVADPWNWEGLEEVRFLTGLKIEEKVFARESIDEAIEWCYQQKESAASDLVATLKEGKQALIEEEGYDLLEQVASSPVIQLLNLFLTEAIQQEASDIHFEPTEQGVIVRYRIDGVLQKRHSPPKELQSQLITRIKVLARMDIAEHRLPQDGRIKLSVGGRSIDFRVSTIPVVYGERVVLRILDKGNIVLGLQNIGMPYTLLEEFRRLIHLSEGIVLVTGPTGSGKTTTLYSAIGEINSSEVNVMTIEDPVEYKLTGMAQVGVNPKINLDFATGLRHILRQDPDVIMIGEIRDKETAEIAIQSSLTGHLVLSTLHTNDAPSALTRLVDMGIEPYLLTSSVVGILAQRLVRLICTHCKRPYTASSHECEELSLSAGTTCYEGVGCPACYGSGYKGRQGVYELMSMTSGIKKQLLKSADAAQIRKTAMENGWEPLRIGGTALILKGLTTTAEVLRVSRNVEI